MEVQNEEEEEEEGSDSQLDEEKVGVREIESDYKLEWINGYVEH